MQHETGTIAIKCHDRCARLHIQRDQQGFSIALEDQLLMNSAYHTLGLSTIA
jgi:nuclear mRNA export protein SAC3